LGITTMTNNFSFTVHAGDQSQAITEKELAQYANYIELDKAAPGRYSWLLVLQTLLHTQTHGIDPTMIVEEIKALEGKPSRIRTKPASEFKNEPLKGLWHKHFFSARFIAHNIKNQLSGGRLKTLISEVFNPAKSPVVTAQMINELSHRVVSESFEAREQEGKLTGEWIVFAKHDGKNYYLTISTHNTGDEVIYEQIKSVCFPQFPFLATTAKN
jgi:hypothetical protein